VPEALRCSRGLPAASPRCDLTVIGASPLLTWPALLSGPRCTAPSSTPALASPVPWRAVSLTSWPAPAGGSRWCSPTTAQSSAQGVRQRRTYPRSQAAVRSRGSAPDQRVRRTRAAHHPRGVLATNLRTLPGAQIHRSTQGPGALPRLLQLGPSSHRTEQQWQSARYGSLRF
jgi:hypothetical protein